MRLLPWIAMLTLMGCGGDKDGDTDIPNANTDGNTTTDTGTRVPIDTALAVMGYFGDISVDTDAGTYVGTETYYVTSVAAGNKLCEFVYQVNGTPTVRGPNLCADPEGNPCVFGFDADFTDGAETAGNCSDFFGTLSTAWEEQAGYGYHEDYAFEGTSYGPALMYYFSTDYYTPSTSTSFYDYYGWGGALFETYGDYVTWDAASGNLKYDWVSDTISYFP